MELIIVKHLNLYLCNRKVGMYLITRTEISAVKGCHENQLMV
jgi:hypothetical protein